jgi:hypothetical protein
VPAYQARQIAAAIRHLSVEQAKWVDARLAPLLGAVSWGRLQTLLEAASYQADPVGAEHQASAAAQERFVRLGRASEQGLKLIIARATAGDAIWFKATGPAAGAAAAALPGRCVPVCRRGEPPHGMDHTIPYLSPDKGGPPGQTGIGNLGPHVRRNHRRKTHAGWQVRQPEPGTWLWRSPTAGSTWSTPPAPTHSATPNSPKLSGRPRQVRQELVS